MESSPSADRPRGPRALTLYFLLAYVATLVATAPYLAENRAGGVLAWGFLGAVWITYSFVYLLPAVLPVLLIALLLRVGPVRRALGRVRFSPGLALLVLAVVLTTGVQVVLLADRFLFHLYGWHLNGFVVNLVMTPGGIESLGSSAESDLSFAWTIGGLLALQVALAVVATWIARRPRLGGVFLGRRRILAASVALVVLGVGERVAYGLSEARAYAPVLVSGHTFPFYVPTRFREFAGWLGVEAADRDSYRMNADDVSLKYPLAPIVRRPDAPRHNIVWLVSESLRWDMLTPEIMPETYAFTRQATWFRDHVSGGNGTRMGVFSMFYGLDGPYWFPFLEERRGPVLIDLLLENDYQMGLYTSARFSYPEFDSTVFSRVPSKDLHEHHGARKEGWRRDRENVAALLGFLDGRDRDRPFFTFLFFESPHARYYFPPESVIREPYAKDVNYARMDVEADAELLRNRYVNSCHHLDSQLGRILAYLAEDDLLDDTIVVVTGDHGEEFMEHGRWGHNSDFVREQIQVPLVLHVPGRAPGRIDRLTSHVDLPVTVLEALGVENPPGDYAVGRNLFTGDPRRDAVASSWNDLAYIDEESYAVFPVRGLDLWSQSVHTRDGRAVADPAAYLATHRERLLGIMKDLRRFSR